jgi:hypothetical protein
MASNGDFFLSGPAGTGGLSWNSGTGALVVNGSGTFTGALAGGTISCPTSNPKFTVTAAGAMTATDATISGDITATTGVIGGWTVGSSQLYSPSSSTSNRLTLNAGGAPSLSINNSSGGVATEINSNATLSTGFGSTPSLTATSLAKSPTTPTSVNLTAGVNLYSRVNGQTSSGGAPTSAVSWVDLTNYVTISGLANGSCTIQATQDVTNTYATSVHSLSSYGGPYSQFTSVSGIVEFGFVIQTGAPSTIGSGVVGYHTKTLLDGIYGGGNQAFWPSSYGVSNNVGQISFTASSNTTYYLIPYVKREQYTVYYPQAFSNRTINFKTATAPTTSISASQPVSRTEICAGGLQVVSTSSNYVKMQRNTAASGAGSVMLSVGGSIEATGNITANASDKRLKDIKGLITNPLSKLKQLNGVIYNWNNLAKNLAGYDSSIDNVGLIAQDVQKVLPEAVARAPFDTEKDEQGRVVSSKSGKDYLTIWYERLVPLLVEGVKELTERVDKLEEENKKLKE